MDRDVLVVGAGPVGLTLAAELTRFGVSVRIVDKAAQRTDTSKALVLWSRSLELLDRAGCADAFLAAGHAASAANIVAAGRLIGRIGFDGVQSPYPYGLMLPQSETERLLEAHLAGLGTSVDRQTELTSFLQHADGVTSTLRRADGTTETLQTAWLIGCDGAHSMIRHALGMTFAGDTLDNDWVLADVHLSGLQYPASELVLFWHQDGLLAVFPISPGRYRVIADLGPGDGQAGQHRSPEPTLDQIQAIVEDRGPGGIRLSDPIWLSGFRINERKVSKYRSGRAFLAGDAAHVHSPAGGQGMNTGMQDAFNLAWKLVLACNGTSSADLLLNSYSAERSAIGDQVVSGTRRLTAIAAARNHTAQALRNMLGGFLLGLSPLRRGMADNLSEVSIGYAHSPLNGPGAHGIGGPTLGERAPVVHGQVPVGAGDTPRFALFAHPDEQTLGLLRKFPEILEPEPRPPFGDAGAWLVRPDGYVGCTTDRNDVTPMADYLMKIVP